jgi:hypothetical protein
LSAFGGIAMPTMALKGCKTSRDLASSRYEDDRQADSEAAG